MIKIESASEERLQEIEAWEIWEKEPTSFGHFYEKGESFYFLEGLADITDQYGNIFRVRAGDLVTIDKGSNTTWVVREKVKKHFLFF